MTSLWSIGLIATLAILWNHGSHREWFGKAPANAIVCDDNHGYQIGFLSQEPLLIHVQNFLTIDEATYFRSIL
jgi:hypothetical protein